MQGDKIGEESGKVTLQRVLPNPGGGPKMERIRGVKDTTKRAEAFKAMRKHGRK